MPDLSRRDAFKLAALAPLAPLVWSEDDARRAARHADAAPAFSSYKPAFFTPEEWMTVSLLADLLLPADTRSPSATEVGVPQFIDFMMIDRPPMQLPMRGGLAWLDAEMRRRTGAPFREAGEAARRALLDDIAWPETAPDALSHGVAFFNRFRDLTATGFWTTREGIDDLQYRGNTYVHQWDGCPPEAHAHLGLDG